MIQTYTEMNAKIVAILRNSDDPLKLYAAQRIEELEARSSWWRCATHGRIDGAHAWGCPECVREMREKLRECRPV